MARQKDGCWYLMTICFQAAVPLGLSSVIKTGVAPVWFEEEAGVINCSLVSFPGWK